MSTQWKLLVAIAALLLALATAAAAAGSHALDGVLEPRALRSFETAVRLQFYHGLGLLALPFLAERFGAPRLFALAAWMLVAGTVLFCGGVYSSAFGAPLGSVAPIGGMTLIAGWLVVVGAAIVGRRGD